jgi:hypothetical protein
MNEEVYRFSIFFAVADALHMLDYRIQFVINTHFYKGTEQLIGAHLQSMVECCHAHEPAFPKAFFDQIGLVSLLDQIHYSQSNSLTAIYRTVRTVV